MIFESYGVQANDCSPKALLDDAEKWLRLLDGVAVGYDVAGRCAGFDVDDGWSVADVAAAAVDAGDADKLVQVIHTPVIVGVSCLCSASSPLALIRWNDCRYLNK